MNARTMDPVIGRFLQIDPLLEYSSPYTYVGNNPLGYTDPSDMASCGSNYVAFCGNDGEIYGGSFQKEIADRNHRLESNPNSTVHTTARGNRNQTSTIRNQTPKNRETEGICSGSCGEETDESEARIVPFRYLISSNLFVEGIGANKFAFVGFIKIEDLNESDVKVTVKAEIEQIDNPLTGGIVYGASANILVGSYNGTTYYNSGFQPLVRTNSGPIIYQTGNPDLGSVSFVVKKSAGNVGVDLRVAQSYSSASGNVYAYPAAHNYRILLWNVYN